ncbi:baseplate assembly protein [Erwinia phage vB_EamM_ChrisDB]|uniref:baseplate assembly protein n=1 Tax=Erwinia phage vB_EamM_ChrisDB TaxID=1883371 RepID=UPI00081CDAA2|nr:baseplate assembly protein [Erwinia phage vB_EamM_ChrisDB]ANZ48757.1 putative structural protein [Erwinia phage vB_EamM_ChrisDB]
MEKSNVDFYSLGVVAEDKPRGTDRVKIIPIEVSFMEPTKVAVQESETEHQYSTGTATDNLKVKEGNHITAKWWKFNSNRVNSPDVKKEDQVLIYRLGKTDIYFWVDLNSSNVKRLEDAIYAWSGDPKNQMADDLSNAYVMNFSPMDKHITIRTSMSNGEKNAYIWQFNTRDGTWLCRDDLGNQYYMNSQEYDLGFENAMRSKININKEDAFIFTTKSINMETKLVKVKCDIWDATAAKTVDWKTKQWTTDSPKSTYTGNFDVGKDFSYGGTGEGKGLFTVTDAVIANITFSVHTHREQGDGNLVSKPQ